MKGKHFSAFCICALLLCIPVQNIIGQNTYSVVINNSSGIFPTPQADRPEFLTELADGGQLISDAYYSYDIFFLKLDSDGTAQWEMKYTVDSTKWVKINDVISLPDSGYFLSGRLIDKTTYYASTLLMRFDKNGGLRWKRMYYFDGLFAGTTKSFYRADGSILLFTSDNREAFMRIDANNGNYISSVNYQLNSSWWYYANDAVMDSVGNIYVIGGDLSTDSSVFYYKLDSSLQVVTARSYSNGLDDPFFESLALDHAGNLIIAGNGCNTYDITGFGFVYTNDHLVKLDQSGQVIYSEEFTETMANNSSPIVLLNDSDQAFMYHTVLNPLNPSEHQLRMISALSNGTFAGNQDIRSWDSYAAHMSNSHPVVLYCSWPNDIYTGSDFILSKFDTAGMSLCHGDTASISVAPSGILNVSPMILSVVANLNYVEDTMLFVQQSLSIPPVGDYCQLDVGIPAHNLSGEIMLYPDPAIDGMTIQINGALHIAHVEIYNSIGEIVSVIRTNGTTQDLRIDRNELPAGVYFLRVYDETGCCRVKKAVFTDR